MRLKPPKFVNILADCMVVYFQIRCSHSLFTALPAAMRYILKAESYDRRGVRGKLYCIIAGSAVYQILRLNGKSQIPVDLQVAA
ncbi:hypothetical protein CDG79_33255 [Nostoc sp. 'Peltigera membranacea cyanobiont' 232]|nr:hypothetical protein CDG79_33255 [Nostoc sp. 'Peltigera membranacea cyanobiont' 232]